MHTIPPKEKSDPLAQKVAELEQKLAAMTKVNKLSVNPTSPFTPEIDRVRANPTKKMPPIETYDGTSDPNDHTHTYERIMRYYDHFDAA